LGEFFSAKISPKSLSDVSRLKFAQCQKNSPNGEISPNLVTLATSFALPLVNVALGWPVGLDERVRACRNA
jgi:hypothetical protein